MGQRAGAEREAALMSRVRAAHAVRTWSPLGDETKAARSWLRELTRQRDLLVDDAGRRAAEEWAKAGPKMPRVWFGRWRRRLAWRLERQKYVQAARDAATKRYGTIYLQNYGMDFDKLARAAQRECDRLSKDRTAEMRAAHKEIAAVVKTLHQELHWNVEMIALKLQLATWEVRVELDLPQPRPRSHASGGGGGDYGYYGGYDGGGGDGGGGGGGGGGE